MCIQTQRSQADVQQPPITEFPPSVKLVYKTLEYEGPLTHKGVVNATRLPDRTARGALDQLQEHGYVEEELYPHDARQRLYVLTTRASSTSE